MESPVAAGTNSLPWAQLVSAPGWVPEWLANLLKYVPSGIAAAGMAIVVIVGAYVLSRLVTQLLGRRISQRFRRPSLTRTVLRGIRVSIFLFALLTVLRIYGLGLGDIALSVTVFSAVVGVVLAPIVGSIISGIFLLADQPYEIGDMVELADTGERGFVEDITLRYTKLFTLDNTFLVIPNGSMRDRDVVNYSAEDARTRQSVQVLVTYESDIQRARDLIEESARAVDSVVEGGPAIRVGAARYPAGPTCYIDDFGDHGVLLTLRYWLEEPYWLLRVRSKIQTNLWDAIAEEDVEIAYPHQHHIFDETSGQMQVDLDNGPTVGSGSRAPREEMQRRRSGESGGSENVDTTGDTGTGDTGTGNTGTGNTGAGDTS